MSPPNLTGDTPITDIIHPVCIGFSKTFRHELCSSIFNTVNSRLHERFHFDKPLFGNQRLNNCTAALAMSDSMGMVFNLYQEPLRFKFTNKIFAALVTFLPDIFSSFLCHLAIHADYYDALQIMAHTHFKVVRVMGRCNLHGTGSEFQVNIRIGNDRNNPIGQRQPQGFADKMAIALILRINGYSSITKHRFRPGSRDSQEGSLFFHYRITNVPQMARLILMFNLDIGQSRVAVYTPVGNSAALINQSLFVKRNENLTYCFGTAFIHSKTLTLPIAGNTEAFQLINDMVAVLIFPRPNTAQELFAA